MTAALITAGVLIAGVLGGLATAAALGGSRRPTPAPPTAARVTDTPARTEAHPDLTTTGPIPTQGRHRRPDGDLPDTARSATGILRAIRAEDAHRPDLARPTRAQLRASR